MLKVLPKINPYKIAKYFKHFAKVVKFRHIWSHRLQLTAGIDFYWHRAHAVWCLPKMEKLGNWSVGNFLLQ